MLMTIIAPVDSADRLAKAIRDAFATRIETLAKELILPLRRPWARRGPVPIDTIEVDDGAFAPAEDIGSVPAEDTVSVEAVVRGRAALLRNLLVVFMTVAITVGMVGFGSSLEEAVAAATLFLTAAAFAMQTHSHKRLIWVKNLGMFRDRSEKGSMAAKAGK